MKQNNNFKVDFIGVGVPRAGTTWIYECLKEHPQICVSSTKETYFFNHLKNSEQLFENYKQFFKKCDAQKIKGEFSTTYLYNTQAMHLIKKYFPQTKLIVSLRNPIERAYSYYFHIKSEQLFNDTFEEYLKKNPEIINHGKYDYHLKKYLKHLDKNQILILFYQDIKNNPSKTIKKLYNFLEVDDSFVPYKLNKQINPSDKSVYKISFINPLQLNKLKNIFLKTFLTKTILKLFKIIKLNRLANFILRHNRKNQFTRKKTTKPIMNSTTRQYLKKIYQPDIQSLEKLIKKDLSFWH